MLDIFRRAEQSSSKGLAHVSGQLAEAEVLILLSETVATFCTWDVRYTYNTAETPAYTPYINKLFYNWRESTFKINTYKPLKYAKIDYREGYRLGENVMRHAHREQAGREPYKLCTRTLSSSWPARSGELNPRQIGFNKWELSHHGLKSSKTMKTP